MIYVAPQEQHLGVLPNGLVGLSDDRPWADFARRLLTDAVLPIDCIIRYLSESIARSTV